MYAVRKKLHKSIKLLRIVIFVKDRSFCGEVKAWAYLYWLILCVFEGRGGLSHCAAV